VHDDKNGGVELGWKCAHDALQRFHASGGGSDRDVSHEPILAIMRECATVPRALGPRNATVNTLMIQRRPRPHAPGAREA
jgi:hypothetical protein